jgi:glycine betaine/choline ABC-type transport system substrate-binding protein
MRRMNLAVDGEHRSPAEVARDFLKAQRENEGERP